VAVSSAIFVWAAYKLGPLCFALSPVASDRLLVLAREALHLVRAGVPGLAMAVARRRLACRGGRADGAVVLAIASDLGWRFDVLYACQDLEFDARTV